MLEDDARRKGNELSSGKITDLNTNNSRFAISIERRMRCNNMAEQVEGRFSARSPLKNHRQPPVRQRHCQHLTGIYYLKALLLTRRGRGVYD